MFRRKIRKSKLIMIPTTWKRFRNLAAFVILFMIGWQLWSLVHFKVIRRSYLTLPDDLAESYMKVFNQLGGAGTKFEMLEQLLSDNKFNENEEYRDHVLTRVKRNRDKLHQDILQTENPKNRPQNLKKTNVKINLATVACEFKGKEEAAVMLKSAIMFSQDSDLHLIVFTDKGTVVALLEEILKLKWTANYLGWDFTFELHLDWFPETNAGWRKMWQPCSTQRLFFPELLPHIDSLIYLDADTLVLANLTEMWLNFSEKMSDKKLAGMTRNAEARGYYSEKSKIPHFESTGLNAGVALMNLTQMRQLDIQKMSIKYYEEYQNKIVLADQDIYNIIFHFHPEKLLVLDCSYNFYYVHCPDVGSKSRCDFYDEDGPFCFCKSVAEQDSGVRIFHGNRGSFYRDFGFMMEMHRQFSMLDLIRHPITKMVDDLKLHFSTQDSPCFSLTENNLYYYFDKYFRQLNAIS